MLSFLPFWRIFCMLVAMVWECFWNNASELALFPVCWVDEYVDILELNEKFIVFFSFCKWKQQFC